MSPRLVGLLLVVSCVGCWGAKPSPDYFNSRAALEAFLNDLSSGQIEAAYARTSASYQQEHNLDAFKAWINQSPTLVKKHTVEFDNMHGEVRDRANVHTFWHFVFVNVGNRSEKYKVDLIKEYDVWKIDKIYSH